MPSEGASYAGREKGRAGMQSRDFLAGIRGYVRLVTDLSESARLQRKKEGPLKAALVDGVVQAHDRGMQFGSMYIELRWATASLAFGAGLLAAHRAAVH